MRVRLLAIGLIAGTLTACTSSQTDANLTSTPTPAASTFPSPTPSTTTSNPSPSPTGPLTTGPNVRPGEKPPVFPTLATQHTAAGALVFGAYYFRAFDWSAATNNPSLIIAISSPTCDGCNSYENGINELKKTGGVLHGGRVTVVSAGIERRAVRIKADFAVDVAVDEQATIVEVPGRAPRTAASAISDDHSLVFVSWQGDKWRVIEVTAL